MKRLAATIIGVLVASVSIYLYGCGETDPALAPAGSSISFVGYGEEATISDSWACDQDWNVPDPCFTVFRQYCIDVCAANAQNGQFPDTQAESLYNNCLSGPEACADLVCDTYDKWIATCEENQYAQAARNFLRAADGRCGFIYYLVPAVVNGSISSSSTTSAGGSSVTNPLDDIEVRWTTMGGALYKPSDDPTKVPPLANPYYDRTNDRGISEVKYQLPIPTRCGQSASYELGASIGVDAATASFDLDVEAGETTDDDTTSADDDTAV
jgi:hypothetical protein